MTDNVRVVDLMMDSGAFGAWKRGKTLDVDDYIEYIHHIKDLVWSYVNLDVIPGYMGKMDRSTEAVDKSAAASYANLKRMRKAGLKPIPVFHQGESFDWLEQLVDDGEPYIGISPYMRSHRDEMKAWFDAVYSRITDKEGKPLVKTHAFGMTSPNLLLRYPFFTADSTVWAINYGQILVPMVNKDGSLDLTRRPISIYVTEERDDPRHPYQGLTDPERKRVDTYFEYIGLHIGLLRNGATYRRKAQIAYFRLIEEECQRCRIFQHRVPHEKSFSGRGKTIPFYFVFVSNPGSQLMNRIMNEAKLRYRLLSYWDMKEQKRDREWLERFVTRGMTGTVRPPGRNSRHYDGHRRVQLVKHLEEQEDYGD